MTNKVSVGKKAIGAGEPVYIIAEIGINHNGDIEIAKQLMDVAVETGCDAVKFQKRTPEICVPEEQKSIPRETPWGSMTYFEYKKRIEFEQKEFEQIDAYAKKIGIDWFASPWDVPSVDFLEGFNVPCQKIASACLTDSELLTAINKTKTTTILSTGMSSMQEIDTAVSLLSDVPLVIAQATSTYPAEATELNLRVIQTFADKYKVPVGYSGHERGLQVTIAAVALGATFIERHITLDRSMWGTDHSASLEPEGLKKLVRDIRIIELALGDGKKKVYDSEVPVRAKLRRVPDRRQSRVRKPSTKAMPRSAFAETSDESSVRSRPANDQPTSERRASYRRRPVRRATPPRCDSRRRSATSATPLDALRPGSKPARRTRRRTAYVGETNRIRTSLLRGKAEGGRRKADAEAVTFPLPHSPFHSPLVSLDLGKVLGHVPVADAEDGQTSAHFLDLLRRRATAVANDQRIVERITAQGRRELDRCRIVMQRTGIEQHQVEMFAKPIERIGQEAVPR